jgi:polyribonucleotide nucleotidyltransferase
MFGIAAASCGSGEKFMDLKKKSFSMDFMGRPLTLEVSKLAEQANAAVIGKYGETTVLATVVMEGADREIDYLPLMVDYEQKHYAIGKILGGRYNKREGKASDNAILCGRMIDRTIRPLFDYRLRRDIQVVVTVLTFDGENDHTFIGLLAASAALGISDIPWGGPVAAVNLARVEGKVVVEPKLSAADKADFEGFVSGTKDFINMIEFDGHEAKEADIVTGFEAAHKAIGELIEFQNKIVKELGKPKQSPRLAEPAPEVASMIDAFISGKLKDAIYVKDKVERQKRLSALKTALMDELKAKEVAEWDLISADTYFEAAVDGVVHAGILDENRRPDDRAVTEIRELHAEVKVLPRMHGSSLFVRGNTQALGVVTLDAPGAGQVVESIDWNGTKKFLLHYNFPGYSVGETGSFRGPGRREIGHGALAEKALKHLIPSDADFPYTIRVVSEILSSNGSSSMATVCAASLALMDAGVPIKGQAAGIAMGLMSEESGRYKILTDLQGPEDAYGDMDFKVAGTKDGVTAIQLDVKIRGLSMKMVAETLAQAREARLQILDVLNGAIAAPRAELSPYAPIIMSTSINPETIGMLVGPGGKTINGIIEYTGVTSIDIEQDGKVFVTSTSREKALQALEIVKSVTKEFKVGDIVEGAVVKILEFGAIVDLGGDRDGMIHVSELKEGFVKKVEDVVKVGDFVRAKVIKVEDGRIGLSMKALNK